MKRIEAQGLLLKKGYSPTPDRTSDLFDVIKSLNRKEAFTINHCLCSDFTTSDSRLPLGIPRNKLQVFILLANQ